MEVQLYVYDLTHGMAKSMSRQFLGIQIDAVYHTSLVFKGIEYMFGAGVQTAYAGSTHHGQPMEIVPMGTTNLPMDTILEYLESLKQIYTPESYDLFAHNCNNFTNDFAMFLVGKGIPDHITSLPKRVLETPFGRMLKPQIEAGMRSVTQAPVAAQNVPAAMRPSNGAPSKPAAGVGQPNTTNASPYGKVINVSSLEVLEKQMETASQTAATIFFTSSTCAPCKVAYPTYDSLAEQYPHALFLKVDLNSAQTIGAKYQIRATPTFWTFSRGEKAEEWSGADPGLLKANVEKLMLKTFPPHPHTLVKVPTLQYGSLKSVTYAKVPPMEKLMAKLGDTGKDAALLSLQSFIQKRDSDPREATLPDLTAVGQAFRTKVLNLPVEVRFAAVDLLRCAMIDPRISGFFAEEQGTPSTTVSTLMNHINELKEACPHNLRLVTIHLACNLFSSSLYLHELLNSGSALAAQLTQLVTSSLLDVSHPTTRVAASWLAFNLSSANYRVRREEGLEGLDEGLQVELAASLIETLGEEDNGEAVKAQLLALGYLVYCAPVEGEVMDLCKALDAKAVVSGVGGKGGNEGLGREVVSLLS